MSRLKVRAQHRQPPSIILRKQRNHHFTQILDPMFDIVSVSSKFDARMVKHQAHQLDCAEFRHQ